MALAGVRSAIPSDEVIDVMLEVGSAMPSRHRERPRRPGQRRRPQNHERAAKPEKISKQSPALCTIGPGFLVEVFVTGRLAIEALSQLNVR
ncbi:hypothetical protein HMSSN036_89920 [Paenibacillus macerans]|nr:hypothetical protein HMSSN036_89920 [Paenibacillus macerans]